MKQDCLQSKADDVPRLCVLSYNSTTLILDLDLGVPEMYLRTKNEVLGQCFQKLEPEQYRQTYRQIDRHTDRETDRRDQTHYHAACAGAKIHLLIVLILMLCC